MRDLMSLYHLLHLASISFVIAAAQFEYYNPDHGQYCTYTVGIKKKNKIKKYQCIQDKWSFIISIRNIYQSQLWLYNIYTIIRGLN